MSILSRNKKVVMESLDHSEEFENKPLLLAGNKRSNAMATPKERQREDAKKFKAPSPPVILRELQHNNKEEMKRGMPPNPVKVPPKSFLSCNSERYMSPTDSVMSPITRGLLARTRRPLRMLNPWGSSKVRPHYCPIIESKDVRYCSIRVGPLHLGRVVEIDEIDGSLAVVQNRIFQALENTFQNLVQEPEALASAGVATVFRVHKI